MSSIQWESYKYSHPYVGQQCIVGYIDRHSKVRLGLFTYHESSVSAYWLNDSNQTVYCRDNQKWYCVDNLIEDIGRKLKDEISDALQGR